MEPPVVIRPAVAADAGTIAAIYNHYITETIVTFEEEPVSATEIEGRVAEVQAASFPWLVAEETGRVVGYAYASSWKTRCAYRFSLESTVYLAPAQTRRGLGSRLYGTLLPELRGLGIHAVVAGIALPNAASVALHERFGFRKVAHFPEVGFKFDRWIDVGYWQLTV
jgi:phosphinothricin acetyltransferase